MQLGVTQYLEQVHWHIYTCESWRVEATDRQAFDIQTDRTVPLISDKEKILQTIFFAFMF
jgi:hypothetical protein